jgi:hypothetical protein
MLVNGWREPVTMPSLLRRSPRALRERRGITAYLENGGTIENAQPIAEHESPRTTKLYDRTGDEITLDEVERMVI